MIATNPSSSPVLCLPELCLPELALPEPNNASAERACVYESDDLLQGRREAWIEHRGEMYRLRLTGSGKLYLTK